MFSANRCSYGLVPFALLFSAAVIIYALVCTSMLPDADPPSSTKGSRVVDTLKFVIAVSRHGNRRYMTIPNDPYPINDTRLWPYGLGELTTVGRVQMYNLGVKVRALYNGFLNSTYYNDDFYASSTKIDRVILSGDTFLAGLFPPIGFQVWNKNINWQPVPLYTDSQDKTVVMTEEVCQRFVAEQTNSVTQFMADKDNANTMSSIEDYLNPLTGFNSSGYMPLASAWDTFISEDSEGYRLPSWVRKVYPEPMKDIVSKLYIAFFSATDTMARLLIGSFYNEMIKTMEAKVNRTLSPDRKMYFYSGHDSSLISLQYVLGIPKPSIIGLVNPGSAMLFELHQNPVDNRYFMQVLYIDGFSANLEPIVLNIPKCGSSCDFEYLCNNTFKFYNNIDYETECRLNIRENKYIV